MPKAEKKTFKNICQEAASAFKILDQLKNFSSQLKENEYHETDFNKIKSLCSQLSNNWNSISEKSNVDKIKKKLNKRKRSNKSSKVLFYENELKNLFKNMQPLWSENPRENSESIHEMKEREDMNNELKAINLKLYELKEIREKLILYKKLLNVRFQHVKNHTEVNSLVKLNSLIDQTNHRYTEVEKIKMELKEKIIRNQNQNRENNRLKDTKVFEENLKYAENMIKRNLFFSDGLLKPFNSHETFQMQSDFSVNKLLEIRQEWDNFVSNSTKSESIPIEWVNIEIKENDQTDWLKYLVR